MTNSSTEQIVSSLCDFYRDQNANFPLALHEPFLNNTQASAYAQECINTGWLSTAGKMVNNFEDSLCRFTGACHAVAVVNGTVALRLGLHLLGVKPGDEVITSSFTFIATANSISHLGAVPHFVDVEPEFLGLDPIALRSRLEGVAVRSNNGTFNSITGRRIAAIIPVHVFGRPCRIQELVDISSAWDIPVLEDSTEALGSFYNDKHCGLYGKMGTLSFNGNKLISTGGGGALVTNSKALAERARHLSTTAKVPHPWLFNHTDIAWNDRLPNINAALGYGQMENLQFRLACKQKLHSHYHSLFSKFDDVELLRNYGPHNSNHWLNAIRFVNMPIYKATLRINELLQALHDLRIFARPAWTPLHLQGVYSQAPHGDLHVTENNATTILNLPSSPQILREFRS